MSESFKVFAFMNGRGSVLVVAENGIKVAQIEVADAAAAKEKLANEEFNQEMIRTIKRSDFSTIWCDDPAGNPECIEACKKMEALPAEEIEKTEETTAPDTESQENIELPTQNTEIHTVHDGKETVFTMLQDGCWVIVNPALLKKGDVCRYYLEESDNCEKEWMLTADPELVDEATKDWLIKLVEKLELDAEVAKEEQPAETDSEPAAQPKFPATPRTKMIDVECPETYSEEKIKGLVRQLQRLKADAQAEAAEYRERIKTAEKALFAACDGKSFTQVMCDVVEDWEAGQRKYIRQDNGEVAQVQAIPYEERQMNMKLVPKDETPENPETPATETPVEETTVDNSETETAAEETTAPEGDASEQPAEPEVPADPAVDDFEPPQETTEPVEQEAVEA